MHATQSSVYSSVKRLVRGMFRIANAHYSDLVAEKLYATNGEMMWFLSHTMPLSLHM